MPQLASSQASVCRPAKTSLLVLILKNPHSFVLTLKSGRRLKVSPPHTKNPTMLACHSVFCLFLGLRVRPASASANRCRIERNGFRGCAQSACSKLTGSLGMGYARLWGIQPTAVVWLGTVPLLIWVSAEGGLSSDQSISRQAPKHLGRWLGTLWSSRWSSDPGMRRMYPNKVL